MGVSRIFLDTNFFIYLIQGTGPQSIRTKYLLNAFSSRRDEILTSVMTLGEMLVRPMREGDRALAQRYRRILRSPGITVLPFLEDAAEAFASIRMDKSIKPPDAIQLATAATAGCDLFLTNDERLMKASVPGIHFITSFDKAPF
jgi:predicted nucleic acid-binding protein